MFLPEPLPDLRAEERGEVVSDQPYEELREAWERFRDAVFESLRIPQIVEWLDRRLKGGAK